MSTSCRPSAAVVLLWLVVGAVVSVYLTRTRPTARKAAAREEQRLLWANASPVPTGGVCGGRLSSVGGSGPLLPGKAFLLLVLSHDDKSERIAKSWCQCKPWTRWVLAAVLFVPRRLATSHPPSPTQGGAYHNDSVL